MEGDDHPLDRTRSIIHQRYPNLLKTTQPDAADLRLAAHNGIYVRLRRLPRHENERCANREGT